MKPILFNTEMVRAILESHKTVTRRVVKPQPPTSVNTLYRKAGTNIWKPHGMFFWREFRAPCVPGDILWVRETWQAVYETEWSEDKPDTGENIRDLIPNFDSIQKVEAGISQECSSMSMKARMKYFVFKASDIKYTDDKNGLVWRPSIHMPREAARIFLRVTDVRVERLRDMRLKDFEKEGVQLNFIENGDLVMGPIRASERFSGVWDSTIKPKYRPTYGWDANPWVWVIEFKRISKEEAERNG